MAPISRAFISFRPKQLAANAHDETSRFAQLWSWKCEQIPHLLWDKAKILPVKETGKTSNPRSEYNECTSINCHKYNPGNNIWALNENKLYFVHRISVAWPFSFRNSVATMLQRCAILQTVKTDAFFQIGSFFNINLPCKLWNSDTFYSNSSQSFPNCAPHAAVFSPQQIARLSRMSTIAVLTPSIGQLGKSNNSKSYEWPHLSLNICG